MPDVVWGLFDGRQMRDLMQEVGEHLTGRRIVVRARLPYMRHALGAAYYLPDGSGVIDVDPDLDQARAYKTFLHELAHIRLDWPARPVGTNALLASGVVEPDFDEIKSAPYQANERRMDDQRDAWDAWATDNLHRVYYPSGDRIVDKLRVLLMCKVYRAEEV